VENPIGQMLTIFNENPMVIEKDTRDQSFQKILEKKI
jgi:hypothetical protein